MKLTEKQVLGLVRATMQLNYKLLVENDRLKGEIKKFEKEIKKLGERIFLLEGGCAEPVNKRVKIKKKGDVINIEFKKS